MTYNKKSIEDIEIKAGQKVFVRCDFNVPMKDGVITSDKRIVGALPTIKFLMEKGAKVILSSHMGKPHAIFTVNYSAAPVSPAPSSSVVSLLVSLASSSSSVTEPLDELVELLIRLFHHSSIVAEFV